MSATFTRDKLLELATKRDTTLFDYVIVGSGAGGGPLACRLAEEGKRVLLLEAGPDPADIVPPDDACASSITGEPYHVPGYHAAASEHPEMSWAFSVRHFDDDTLQAGDQKYFPAKDPSHPSYAGPAKSEKAKTRPTPPKGGIQYPRGACLGGSTSVNAMVIIRPNDSDWDEIARVTGDDSWRSDNMQGYFARLERCNYYTVYHNFFRRSLGKIYAIWRKTVQFFNPRALLDTGGHGLKGWQQTSFINPFLVLSIAKKDRTFLKLLLGISLKSFNRGVLQRLLPMVLRLNIVQFLDPNNRDKRRDSPEGISLMPIGTSGEKRNGVRELLVDTAHRLPGNLVIRMGTLATKLIFDATDPKRVVGVEADVGRHLYRAGATVAKEDGTPASFYARAEVILCGGTFNTPQLLMLSGIGRKAELEELGIHCRVDRPGVGRNLQDRYEIAVVSEAEAAFESLKQECVSFTPYDPADKERARWLRGEQGLYTVNGAAIGMLVDSGVSAERSVPDLFCFGLPAAFRGYYWGYSKQLLSRNMVEAGSPQPGVPANPNLWTWLILKAYTRNKAGYVRLASDDARDPPEINFCSFDGDRKEWDEDLRALEIGVKRIRGLNNGLLKSEVQPGADKPDGSDALREWIKKEAWGHHACGTCKLGRADDPMAVVDSEFKVYGTSGLRVVDASIFPTIPAYFIVTPVYMISEKAADTILADSTQYPAALAEREIAAIRKRRQTASDPSGDWPLPEDASPRPERPAFPKDTVGLALSGGGIRCATFGLGVLQGLAAKNKLRRIDIMSTVSGGGYLGGFLGRLFTRVVDEIPDKAGEVQEQLKPDSEPVWWLRKQADYLAGEGSIDLRRNLGAYWRNLTAVHLRLGILLFVGCLVDAWLSHHRFVEFARIPLSENIVLSPWWLIPVAIFALCVVPAYLGFWLTPRGGTLARFPVFSLASWVVLVCTAIAALRVPGGAPFALPAVIVLLLGWFYQEFAGLRLPPMRLDRKARTPEEAERYRDEARRTRNVVVRDRLTRFTGLSLILTAFTVVWFLIDTVAYSAANAEWGKVFAFAAAAVIVALPVIRMIALKIIATLRGKSARMAVSPRVLAAIVVVPALIILTLLLDAAAHRLYRFDAENGTQVLCFITLAGLLFSLVVGRAYDFLNRSSLQTPYVDKLSRTFLGASNDARIHPDDADGHRDIDLAHPADDIAFEDYHPEDNGGPLHLINMCVNETVHAGSGRHLYGDKGLSMCVGPAGISVGKRFHAVWDTCKADTLTRRDRLRFRLDHRRQRREDEAIRVVQPLPAASGPDHFHVLADRYRSQAPVENLSLAQWLGISGAAYSTGAGRYTSLPIALLYGLLNLRTGYWWDTRIGDGDRPSRYPQNLWQRLKHLPATLFRVQTMLLQEWRARFFGPSARFWFLSDGAHFDATGAYELLRRRIPLIIAVDGHEDANYWMEGPGLLARRARVDFGANFEWLDPSEARANGDKDWKPFPTVPDLVRDWVDPNCIGALDELRPGSRFAAALAQVSYYGRSEKTWLLYIKPVRLPEMDLDVQLYASRNKSFPQESTADQFFDEDQWEAYRWLGEKVAGDLFAKP